MADKKTIGVSALIILGLISSTFILSDQTYYCEDNNLVKECYQLSKYYSLDNGKCWNVEGNKLCRSGWILVEDDMINNKDNVINDNNLNSNKIVCDLVSCNPIGD